TLVCASCSTRAPSSRSSVSAFPSRSCPRRSTPWSNARPWDGSSSSYDQWVISHHRLPLEHRPQRSSLEQRLRVDAGVLVVHEVAGRHRLGDMEQLAEAVEAHPRDSRVLVVLVRVAGEWFGGDAV